MPPRQYLPQIRSALRPRPRARLSRDPFLRQPCRRTDSTSPPSDASSDRISKILSRLPRSLRGYASRLRAAPVSHVTAFLILHELTAVVPLVALFGVFHYYVNVEGIETWLRAHYGAYVSEGTRRFERYFRRKGWFGFGEAEGEEGERTEEGSIGDDRKKGDAAAAARYKVVVEVALAYAITKALLPVRIIGSVWATPWFAGVLLQLRRMVRPGR